MCDKNGEPLLLRYYDLVHSTRINHRQGNKWKADTVGFDSCKTLDHTNPFEPAGDNNPTKGPDLIW